MDELDFLLVNALQVHPRVSWAHLEQILGADATNLSRRWARLRSEGLVWSSCYFVQSAASGTAPGAALAFVEVDCVAGQRESVMERIGRNPVVLTIECTSGSRELLLTLALGDVSEVDAYVSTELATVPGVLATRTHFSRRFFKDGSDWRLTALREWQVRQLEALRHGLVEPPAAPSALHHQVMAALSGDLRRSATAIADDLGRSVSTVNRAIVQIMQADWARRRMDFAHNLAGFHSIAVLWLNVPHPQLERVGAALAVMPETRMVVSVVGRANLLAALWLRKLDDYDEIETKLARLFPAASVDDRWLIPRVAKRLGHTLKPDGSHDHFVGAAPSALPRRP